MGDPDKLSRNPRKFLFDANNFDAPDEPEPDAPPPPPVFSLEEMDNEKKQAFERGRAAGLAEAEASRERVVSGLVETMTARFSTLFDAEHKRTGQYEAETLALAKAIFQKTFPVLNTIHGLREVEGMIAEVLENHRQQPEIQVFVNPEYLGDIREIAENILHRLHAGARINVEADDALAHGDCRLAWNDGGAERSATSLAAEIGRILDETLAGKARLRDNGAEAQGEES